MAKHSGAVPAAVVAVLVLGPASSAGADPAAPTDVRSRVTAIDPAVDGIAAEIVGGDSFLRLRVAPGQQVIVAGYEGEPYLRFQADGVVEVNRRSPAAQLNASRFGRAPAADADAAAAPRWEQVASEGSYAWHDHRTHWMATTRPEPPERAWSVPIRVGPQEAAIIGRYRYEAPPPAWPWLAGGALVTLALLAAGRLRWAAVAWASAIAGVLLAAYGLALTRLPGGTTGGVTVVLAVLAAVSGMVGATARSAIRGPLVAGAGTALLVGGWRHVDVLTHSVLTTSWPEPLERVTVALALATGAAALVAGVAQTLGVYQPLGASPSASAGPQEPRA